MPTRAWSETDRALGLEWYITDTEGIGGKLRQQLDDFIVNEILLDGTVLEASTLQALDHKIRPGSWYWIVVEKRKIDTITVAYKIAKALDIDIDQVSYGGLKDTVALTVQIFSVSSNVDISKINSICNDRVKILKIIRADHQFTTQDIWGNRFIITIREVEKPSIEIINECLRQIESRGLPNYYGYQRFGLKRPNTHIIGKLLIMRRFEEAINEMIGTPWVEEDERIQKAREYFLQGNYSKALEYWPRSLKFMPERTIIEHLAKNPRDYVGALRKLPKNLLRLYVEAYQSYLFNKLLSRRIEKGYSIVFAEVGDHVALLDHYKLPTKHIIFVNSESIKEKVNELIKRGRACLVLPVPGYGIKLLSGVTHDLLREILTEERIDLNMFKCDPLLEAGSAGTFRPASVMPQVDSLNVNEVEKIVKITFKLPRGSYATVFLRELMKPSDPLASGY